MIGSINAAPMMKVSGRPFTSKSRLTQRTPRSHGRAADRAYSGASY
jgi:hypothetical protein